VSPELPLVSPELPREKFGNSVWCPRNYLGTTPGEVREFGMVSPELPMVSPELPREKFGNSVWCPRNYPNKPETWSDPDSPKGVRERLKRLESDLRQAASRE